MRRKPVVLVTGANGEMGHGLIHKLSELGSYEVLALDIKEVDPEIAKRYSATITGDILNRHLLERLVSEFEIHTIFHLAALLSTRSEFTPETAHEVNVTGTLNLLKLAHDQSRWHGKQVKFLFPSSIAVYGLPDLAIKQRAGKFSEAEWTVPTTMYGCNKLYCEQLGRYFARHYRQLAHEEEKKGVDFRSIRFPGPITAFTQPSGSTSDYLPEMIHAAAQGKPYECFVREDTRISFMAMPDAFDALLGLMDAPAASLRSHVYNIAAFNPSAGEFAELVKGAFPDAQLTCVPDTKRQAIVDSWPEEIDDYAARRDWKFAPKLELERMFLQAVSDWDKQLVEAIRDCGSLMFVMTADSVEDASVCKNEWMQALKYKKPILLDRFDGKADPPFLLNSRQYLDFTSNFEVGLARLR